MMSRKQTYEFLYEKLKEDLDNNQLSIMHPEKDILFEIDKENVRLYINVGHEKADVDDIWQIGIERYVQVEGEEKEAEIPFKEKFLKHMTEVEDHFTQIGELSLLDAGLDEFILMGF
jgi:hypothetical protein